MPSIIVSQSDYANLSIPVGPGPNALHTFELGHDDVLFQTKELDTSLKELMNRIYKLELDVHELKQQLRGDIKL